MTDKKLYIITGASRGLGKALVEKAIGQGAAVIAITRGPANLPKEVTQIHFDLSRPDGLESILRERMDLSAREVVLINNAAVLGPLGKISSASNSEIQTALAINLHAPILLAKLILELFDTNQKRSIVNISSGGAFRPIEAWSIYCTTKAGLKMFSENLRLDYQPDSNFRILNFSPGVMDTGMQEQIRSLDEKTFSRVNEFRRLKSEGTLLSVEYVASRLLEYLDTNQTFENVNLDIRDMK